MTCFFQHAYFQLLPFVAHEFCDFCGRKYRFPCIKRRFLKQNSMNALQFGFIDNKCGLPTTIKRFLARVSMTLNL